MFSSNTTQPFQVDSEGLKGLTLNIMKKGLQVTDSNPIAGLEGRTSLLTRLSDALLNTQIFGADGRPGNMLGNYTHRDILQFPCTKILDLCILTPK